MDKQKAKIIFDLSRSSSNEKVVRGLRELKKRLVTNTENLKVFRSLGLMPHVLKLVQRPNEDILNGSLSILSICCSDEHARSEVFELGGTTHLLNVLKCAKSESLQLRACRTIANQAQHKPSCDRFFVLKAPDLVIDMLKNCKEDEAKSSAIRAIRFLANNGEHSQKIVKSKGILYFCKAAFETAESSSNMDLLRAGVKTLAHFSRISHPASINQIMEGTDNMMTVSKIFEANQGDQEIYEYVIKTIVNIVQSCFAPSHLKREALDARVLDRLCTALFPTKIVLELQNRRISGLDDDKLILTLCKFCQGSNECLNLAPNSLVQPPTFMGRAWMQLIECGGVAMLVNLLIRYRHDGKLRPAILKAILGVEHNYSFREPVLKHLLAAQILPQLAEQFDEVMADYKKVRREPQQNCCTHTFPLNSVSLQSELEVNLDLNVPNESETNVSEKLSSNVADDTDATAKMCSKEQNRTDLTGSMQSAEGDKTSQEELNVKGDVCKTSHSVRKVDTKATHDHTTSTAPDVPGNHGYPQSPESVSCSPHSHHSNSGCVSPTWSPAHGGVESPVLQHPVSLQHNMGSVPPWSMESPCTSTQGSPYSSPPHSPILQSMSPIRVPSDWEYEDEDDADPVEDSGRFSPVIPHLKGKETEDEDESEIDEDSQASQECEKSEKDDIQMEDSQANDTVNELGVCKNEEMIGDIDKKLIISASSGKRLRELTSPSGANVPEHKKLKLEIPDETVEFTTVINNDNENVFLAAAENSSSVSETKEASALPSIPNKEENSEVNTAKSPFVKLNQIKFRVRKRGTARQQINLGGTGENSKTTASNITNPLKEVLHEAQSPLRERKPSSACSVSVYSELTHEEANSLQLLELFVRIIGQIAHVKEAIHKVCMEFVPRIMTYLSTAQVIHKSATRMLVTIAKNPLCIQPLLDTWFIPYVGVELGEAGDPESPSGCQQCRILSDGASAFLDQMVNFFNHVHKYGHSEAINRLHPSRDVQVREGCVMALPHVTRCPKLLHDFMVCYPAMDLLMDVLHSEKPPNDANYMYAAAAISRLALTLKLDKQVTPVKCPVCFERGNHTPEEVAQHFKLQQKDISNGRNPRDNAEGILGKESLSGPVDPHICRWKQDSVHDVTFKLSDGSTLSANRELLAEKNEVLKNMLMGSFSEGINSCIELPEISKASLEILIHFLYGCRCEVMESGNVKTYIDLVFLSQMYMLNSLLAFAMAKMISSIQAGGDIIRIYESSVGAIDENLILQALCTVLIKPMKTWKRARWLKELFQSTHASDIDHNIRMILHHPLDINRLICNCDQSMSLYRVSESEYTKLC